MPERKCYRCGHYYSHGEKECEHCHVRLSMLDGFRVWRRLRRAFGHR